MAEIQEIEKLSPEGGGRPPGTGPSSSQGQPPPLAPATLTANDEPIQGVYTRNNYENDPEKAAAGAEPVQQTYDKSFWLAFWSMLIMNLAAAYEASTLAVAVPVGDQQLLCVITPLWIAGLLLMTDHLHSSHRISHETLAEQASRPFGREPRTWSRAPPSCCCGPP